MPEALVFDYDGVLADTEVLHWKSWVALLSRYDIQYSWEEYCGFGRGVDDGRFCEVMSKRAPVIDAKELWRQNLERKCLVRQWSVEENPIPPETIALLGTLGAHRLGLVTSSAQAEVEPILRAAGIYEKFDAMVFGTDVTALKPAPEPYLLIARKLGVTTGIAFEDSEPGIDSARAAGFRVVRVDQPRELARMVKQSLPQA